MMLPTKLNSVQRYLRSSQTLIEKYSLNLRQLDKRPALNDLKMFY